MKKLLVIAGTLAALTVPAFATEEALAARKALMQSVGAAAGVTGGVMKDEIAYNPAMGKAAIAAMHATATVYGNYFPEGSDMDPDTSASPKIWEDMDGFLAKLGEFQTTTAAAVQASGKDGPADAEAFKAAMGPVMQTCKGCHETYRIEN